MTYSLKFLPSALEEWENINNSIKPLFKKKLQERLNNPHAPASRLRGFENHYKIKLKKAGFRLVYEVLDDENSVLVIAVGKREDNLVYRQAQKRSKSN
ncbi:type II toxin-antitoxin system RelE family toxin [Candidatus Marithrix sp. Canyon 246]|uniref:type II toxin-antitoxin system RelE family toxin n=1 Tax=Candidatus Marithrix sp. Canyon 246 TaxID=1827136 RepID=UPI00084A1E47|nr:type II toxin-antitoxin system RelE/ParE family toxin [Candidatus Marithrix sp. Canyon 246]